VFVGDEVIENECAVEVTPQSLKGSRPESGESFERPSDRFAGKRMVGSAAVRADEDGLVTSKDIGVGKGGGRSAVWWGIWSGWP